MKALIFGGPGQRSWESADDPGINEPTDVVVKVDTTTICGTDLHILKGDVPAVTEGRVLGHEAVGTVVETGAAVSSLNKGDRVLVPAITSCGRCGPCKRGMAAHCEAVGGIGWIFGHLIDGVQSEYARVPYAETSVHLVPEGVSDEQVIFLADILPTGFEIGVQNGRVAPGDTVAVVGAGPVGLAAMMTGAIAGAGRIIAVDPAESRLKHALKCGATHTVVAGDDAEAQIGEITGGEGVDVAMEAVGIPATFDLCTRIVKAGGTVANIGVHGAPTTLHLEELWIKNITITTGLVSGSTIPTLLSLVRDGKIQADLLGTHQFKLDEIMDAYDVFAAAGENDALKVVLTAS
jgi:alcohol dehydrogenase